MSAPKFTPGPWLTDAIERNRSRHARRMADAAESSARIMADAKCAPHYVPASQRAAWGESIPLPCRAALAKARGEG